MVLLKEKRLDLGETLIFKNFRLFRDLRLIIKSLKNEKEPPLELEENQGWCWWLTVSNVQRPSNIYQVRYIISLTAVPLVSLVTTILME